jgi:predicted GIY-YIG superfamily endonuclease
LYIGSTPDLRKRLKEHNDGRVRSTKSYIPLRLIYPALLDSYRHFHKFKIIQQFSYSQKGGIYYEAYLNREDALDREHKLKHHGSVIGHLKRRLKNSLK